MPVCCLANKGAQCDVNRSPSLHRILPVGAHTRPPCTTKHSRSSDLRGSPPALRVGAVARAFDLIIEPELRQRVDVRTVLVLRVPAKVLAHLCLRLGGERQIELPIDPPYHIEWFVQELLIPHVHELLGWRASCIASLGAASDIFGKHSRHLRTNCQRVHSVTERPPQSHVEAGERTNTPQRVATED